ncbi:acetyl-CoA carboxylase biotin carboxylase subunit [Burkholderia cenocepacia]|uniref:Biotin carboxylase n=1 Tax=Burkholderia cenocepacia TaxID=95486 RepID=A0A6B2MK72_9BURK|nr:acetyl-CoA carboxylase biotin carboxylase subunit [Burkholderia cenocepacia]MBN3505794.1 acetyl-CoA carboxylase biotin carboxylase subunit [Burkholderia cenocepacia]MCO1392616.1 acetyl-CoA carboxylase biotin carboxylase subunit [Burkholderia cenocepacia]MCO1406567.1 acetyl-CoA carboxylase biotin carboxylase subunit [Burkholderia cenocepacia]MDI9675685.1 acetyl-CoA carboxylase biotin carboxylase subunit [Burkholderia cenocepacia]NDV75182.1 acetyl-CoA carboxylase biotin carboxylase subunit [B
MSSKIKRLLVANRGEIAVRIIRACRELGIETVQVFSEADRDSLAVRMADRAVCIGGAKPQESYLHPQRILAAATALDVDAIHPGYGFLSENADFADLVEAEGFIFVGPTGASIRAMGDKAMARKLAEEAGVPTTPGSKGVVTDAAEAATIAEQIGYPVLLKASAGGGGRGMRVVNDASMIEKAFLEASREATVAFGNGAMYLEKFLSDIRHIEIQVLGDGRNVLHLGERDCSTQRRNQKLIEESPSPVLNATLRAKIGEAAVSLCKHVQYRSAGTIECILDPASQSFYFMEMNTRIQVEHPVTEMVSGIDLVKAQIRIAAGESIERLQADVRLTGHAIECRINAEDPELDFQPKPGKVQRYSPPGGIGVRVDSHLFSGYVVPPYYDSLLGKVICWGETRTEAIERMQRALRELEIDGVQTTREFHLRLIGSNDFAEAKIHTRYIQDVYLKERAKTKEAH